MKHHLLWMGIKGLSLSEEEKTSIQKNEISGLILFKRNIESLSQLLELCREIKSLKPAPLIMMDREGGMVDRLCHLPDFPAWPEPAWLSHHCSPEQIQQTALYMASEMKALGICLNFAPVVDTLSFQLNPTGLEKGKGKGVADEGLSHSMVDKKHESSGTTSIKSSLLKGRLWGSTPEQVSRNALAWIKGFAQAGIASCVKHFPGHGGVTEDSHKTLPIDKRDLGILKKYDLIPFQKTISAGVDMVMTAHVAFPSIEIGQVSSGRNRPDIIYPIPATVSYFLLKQVLRQEMGFQGLVVSDDLGMKALHYGEHSESYIMNEAFSSGVDILLKCEPPKDLLLFFEKTLSSFEGLKTGSNEMEEKVIRLKKFQKKYSAIQPVGSLKELKQIMFRARKWYEALPSYTQRV